MLRLHKKLNLNSKDKRNPDLIMPRVITLYQKCVEHKIQDCLIARLHFNDLYVLILSLDIQNIKTALRQKSNMSRKKSNIEVRDISQSDAVKFLKGGGVNGG